jgi:hypothetical protein
VQRGDLLLPAAVAAVIGVLTTTPISGPARMPTVVPLVVHVAMFATLAGSLGWSWHRRGWAHPLLGPALIALAYGVAIEAVQAALPYRTGAVVDMAADGVGAVIGAAVARWWLRYRSE